MADESRPPGRRWPWRRPSREAVPVGFTLDDEGDDGSAGVREPRRPKPTGPMGGAGERPVPDDPIVMSLPDPRR